MEEKVIDRIEMLISFYGLSKNAFDASIDKANGYIGKQIKKRASIGSDTVETILRIYKEISPSWLIAGEGRMLRGVEENDTIDLESSSECAKDIFEKTLLLYLDKPHIKDKIKNLLKDGEEEKSS